MEPLLRAAIDLFAREFDPARRPLRLRFAAAAAGPLVDGVLLPQRLDAVEGVCEGVTAHVTCLSTQADLPLKALLGQPVEVQVATAEGGLRRLGLVVTEARHGQSDGGLATLQFTGRDMLAVMEGRRGSRVFLNRNVLDIARAVFRRWRATPAIAQAFDHAIEGIDESRYPPRAMTLQANQSDADFLRALFRRDGLSWFFRAGPPDKPPSQCLVLVDARSPLDENEAGALRYHRRDVTEPEDTLSLLAPAHTLVSGAVVRNSWDHEKARVDTDSETCIVDQGPFGNALAEGLVDARIELPHVGDTWVDHRRLTRLDIQRHEFRARALHGVGGVRAQAVGEWNRIDDYPAFAALAPEAREHTTIRLQTWCENNLPKALDERAQRLLAASEASLRDWVAAAPLPGSPSLDTASRAGLRFVNRFLAVPRDVPLVPAWDPQADLPAMPFMTATVSGLDGVAVWCDELGRVKLRLHGFDPDPDDGPLPTAWVRVNSLWCGPGFGVIFPLRPGMEVSVGFEMGDPSRPMIVGARHNIANPPPAFDHLGGLPANAALSGIVTREIEGARQQQLRFNDQPGNISVQLGTDHADTQLNLGGLSTPMSQGVAEPRGDGAELRSRAAVALRGAQGVLISSSASNGRQLDRAELVGLSRTLQAIVEQLGALAGEQAAGETEVASFRGLVQRLQDWEKGSHAEPREAGGGAPIVALSAAAGAAIVSQENLVLGARTDVDLASAGHAQVTAGQQIRQRAGAGVSVFTDRGDIRHVAGAGLVDMQAREGGIRLTASGDLVLVSNRRIVLQAPEVQIVGQGAQTLWADGAIDEQASGAFRVRSAGFQHSSPGGGRPADVPPPGPHLKFDQYFEVTDCQSGALLTHQRCRIELPDGQVFERTTDALGRVPVFDAMQPFARFDVHVLD